MKRRLIWVSIFLLCLLSTAWVQQYQVFVNNNPFKGQSSGKPGALMLEAEVLRQMVKFDLVVDRDAGSVTLDGEPVNSSLEGETLLVDAKELADKFGGKYLVNDALKTVDVFNSASDLHGQQRARTQHFSSDQQGGYALEV